MGLQARLQRYINGFSLDVEWQIGNELAVLFGFSGAGKSMTLLLIAGLMNPDLGLVRLDEMIYFDSTTGTNLPPQSRSFGYVIQDLALFPHMTILQNILYGATRLPKHDKRKKAKEMIHTFKLEGLEDRYPNEISGGQKQRVALARALVRQPMALLLDEPFSALDRPLRIEMRSFLREIKDIFNIPVILVTHDFEEAAAIADKIIVYEHGRIAQIGSPNKVKNSPVNEYVDQLVSCGDKYRNYEEAQQSNPADSVKRRI